MYPYWGEKAGGDAGVIGGRGYFWGGVGVIVRAGAGVMAHKHSEAHVHQGVVVKAMKR